MKIIITYILILILNSCANVQDKNSIEYREEQALNFIRMAQSKIYYGQGGGVQVGSDTKAFYLRDLLIKAISYNTRHSAQAYYELYTIAQMGYPVGEINKFYYKIINDYPDSSFAMNLAWDGILVAASTLVEKPNYLAILKSVDNYILRYSKKDEDIKEMQRFRKEIKLYLKDPKLPEPTLIKNDAN